jgi:predicted transcriptional regulator
VYETLAELAATANSEATLAFEAGTAMIQHAINAGEALLAAKRQVPRGQWEEWVADNFDRSKAVATQFMRVARHKRIVIEGQATNFKGALRLLHRGDARDTRIDPVEVAEMKRLRKEGATYRAIADEIGVSVSKVQRTLNPASERRRLEKARRQTIAGRRALNRQKRDAAAKKAGGAISEAYAHIRKALEACERARDEAKTLDAKRAVQDATNRLYNAEDAIVKASRESMVDPDRQKVAA